MLSNKLISELTDNYYNIIITDQNLNTLEYICNDEEDTIEYLGEFILNKALSYCKFHAHNFDPTKGSEITYFSNLMKAATIQILYQLRTQTSMLDSVLKQHRRNQKLELLFIKSFCGSRS